MSTITVLPTPPSRAAPATFALLADAFLAAFETLQSEANVVIGEVNDDAVTASESAELAAAAAASAALNANIAEWVTGTTYVRGELVYSPTNYQSYRRKTNGAGATDPSADTTNWQSVSADLTAGPTITTPVITGGATISGGADVTGGVDVSGGLSLTSAANETLVDLAAGTAINVSSGNWFKKTISGTTTFTVTNAPATGVLCSFVLVLTNGGAATVNWFSGVDWSGGAPQLTVSGVDVLEFFTVDGGTTWYGVLIGSDFA